MMNEKEFRETLARFDEFDLFLQVLARRHLNDGSGASAGVALTCAFEVKAYARTWAGVTPHVPPDGDDMCTVDGCTSPVPSPGLPYCERHRVEKTKTAKHRHDFVESVAKGENPPRCACGHAKKPNGRPRGQQVISPVKGPVLP